MTQDFTQDTSGLEAALAAILRPGEVGQGLPNACYLEGPATDLEQQALFEGRWACIGFGKDVPQSGDVSPVDFLGQPLVIVRGQDKEVRVYHNVCSHRGMILVEDAGNCKGVIRCPYHSWCYDLTGKLRRTPLVGGPGQDNHPDFDKSQHGLRQVRSHVWMDMIFVNLSGDAPAFEKVHSDLMARWSEFAEAPLHHGGPDSTLTFDLQCNWKLAVENYCESYHLPWVHPGLNSYSRIEDHYNIIEDGRYSGQGSLVYRPVLSATESESFPALPGLSPQWDAGAEYIVLYPNVLLGIHKDHFFAILLEPRGAEMTAERVEIYYFDPACKGSDYAELRELNARTWRSVFQEDVGVVEGMQRGRKSPGFQGGVFTPVMDPPTRAFHLWAAQCLSDALAPRMAAQ